MFCEFCQKPLYKGKRFCSISCQQQLRHSLYLQRWLEGLEDGFNDKKQCSLSIVIRNWILVRAGYKCEECSWSRVHPVTGKVPLDVHHKDGNSQNNRPENLQALCPNCHALTISYRNLNKGRGRAGRVTMKNN